MHTCKRCKRSGLMLHLNGRGLCNRCAEQLAARVSDVRRGIQQSLAEARRARDVESRVRQYDLCLRKIDELGRIEQEGEGDGTPDAGTLRQVVQRRCDRDLTRWASALVAKVEARIAPLRDEKEQVRVIGTVLFHLRKYQAHVDDDRQYGALVRDLAARQSRLQLTTWLSGDESSSLAELRMGATGAAAADEESDDRGVGLDRGRNRRQTPRFNNRFEVVLYPGGGRSVATDVSRGGLKLNIGPMLSVGDFVDMEMNTGRGIFHATGLVVWVAPCDIEGAAEWKHMAGIAFTGAMPMLAA